MHTIRGVMIQSCLVCRAEFSAQYPTKKKTCSTRCRQYLRKHPNFSDPTDATLCALCGDAVASSLRRGTRYCSVRCRRAAQKRRTGGVSGEFRIIRNCMFCNEPMPQTKIHRAIYCSARCQMWSESKRFTFADRTGTRICKRCGIEFDVAKNGRVDRIFCTKRCQRYHNANLRHERATKAFREGEEFTSRDVFVRDKWLCHVCGLAIDPSIVNRHPQLGTMDHLIALSAADGPGHVFWNVAAAHLSCNQSRQGRTRPVDFLLIEALQATYAGGDDQDGSEPAPGNAPTTKVVLGDGSRLKAPLKSPGGLTGHFQDV